MFYPSRPALLNVLLLSMFVLLSALATHTHAFDAAKYKSSSASSSNETKDFLESQPEPEFLQVEEAFVFNSEIVDGGVKLFFDIADDYFLYLERFRFKSLTDGTSLQDARFSNTGKKKEDPYFGDVHVIHNELEVFLPVELNGLPESEIKVTYQGCAEAGLCYPPTHQKMFYMPVAQDTSSEDYSGLASPGKSDSNVKPPSSKSEDSFVAGSTGSQNAADSNDSSLMSFFAAAAFALVGGLILNLMPCVFPVLSMKALSLVNMGHEEEGAAKKHGLAYTAGVVLSFVAIAAVLIALKAFGVQIGWGFQLQSPLIVAVLAYLLFLIGLNLSGFFDLSFSLSTAGQSLTEKDGAAGSFFTGVLAAVVASPCVAPFMGAAIAYALMQGPGISLTIFSLLGLGLALPYLALCYFPKVRSMLPKPGPWMCTFKELLAFPMYGAAVWLVWVLSQQSGSQGVLIVLTGMIVITFGLWLRKQAKSSYRLPINILAAVSFVLALAPLAWIQTEELGEQEFEFTEARLNSTLDSSDHPIFVEMTAAWCISCKVNKRVALDTERTRKLFSEHNVEHIVGDWTNRDANITSYLEKFNRFGVPLYVFYGARDANGLRPEPVLLPQILTQDLVVEYVSNASLAPTNILSLR